MKLRTLIVAYGLVSSVALPAAAQDPHAGHAQSPQTSSGWHVMQDGVIYGLFNRQGGPRGDTEFVVPNWWMGMAMRERGRHQFSLNGMLSLDPPTVGKRGYAEIFQVGEAVDGKPLIDRQHPHDFLMQLAASWRIGFGDTSALTLAAGPAGEPTLGPIAFMHRPSAAGLVLATLGHHTFDSTHISFGVVTASFERGRWTAEGSLFNGREPDQDRWDLDLAPLDSFAGRVWFRPAKEWELQFSSGRLRDPEELVTGDVVRTTSSLAWYRPSPDGLEAVTIGYGVNAAHGERRHGLFGEFTIERGANSVSGRIDRQQVETHTLLTGEIPDDDHGTESAAAVTAITVGATRRFLMWRGFENSIGAHVTFHAVPNVLRITHGDRPVSFQLFLRVRLPAKMGRMWNMRMAQAHRMSQ